MTLSILQRTKATQVTAEFLAQLRHIKGPMGRVELRAFHWRPEEGAGLKRDIKATKKVKTDGGAGAGAGGGAGEFDGELRVGECVQLVGKAPAELGARYVHLFNFGTSGKVLKMLPSREFPNNRMAAGEEFVVPSARLCLLGGEKDPWIEGGPATEAHGLLERMLVLATKDDVTLQLEDLHGELAPFGRDLYTRCAARGAEERVRSVGKATARGAGFEEVEADGRDADRPLLFAMAPAGFEYGLLELKVGV